MQLEKNYTTAAACFIAYCGYLAGQTISKKTPNISNFLRQLY